MRTNSPITASEISKTSGCLHYFYLECFGDPKLKRDYTEGEKLRFRKGRDYEKKVMEGIPGLEKAAWEYPDWQKGYESTMRLFQKGPDWIYQGVLLARGLVGIPDLLRKTRKPSKLGPYSYIPVDIKGHKSVTLKDKLQLFAYAYMLEAVLGQRPGSGGIWLNTGKIEEVPLNGMIEKVFLDYLGKMSRIRTGKVSTEPVYCSGCETCLWFDHCSDQWEKDAHVCLLPGVGQAMAKKLKSEGITDYHAVAAQNPAVLAKKITASPDTVSRIIHSAKARAANRPLMLKKPAFPPKSTPIYFYDIETYEDLVYLHGVIRASSDTRDEKYFFAENEAAEKKAWHDFLDLLAQDSEAVIYCWSSYEKSNAERCWARHGGNPKGYRLIKKSLTDQCAFVKAHFALPCRGYSIKKVAPVFGFKWQAGDASGLNCESWYREWREKKDENLRRKIIEYNLDDVRAMEVIDRSLKSFCKANGSCHEL